MPLDDRGGIYTSGTFLSELLVEPEDEFEFDGREVTTLGMEFCGLLVLLSGFEGCSITGKSPTIVIPPSYFIPRLARKSAITFFQVLRIGTVSL